MKHRVFATLLPGTSATVSMGPNLHLFYMTQIR